MECDVFLKDVRGTGRGPMALNVFSPIGNACALAPDKFVYCLEPDKFHMFGGTVAMSQTVLFKSFLHVLL